jgi:hypothetical protein
MPRTSLTAAVVVALAVSLAAATPAAADKPIKEPAPFGEFTGQFCEDFPVRVRDTTNRGILKVFSSGATLITGTLKVEVTNLETGKSIALNVSGPARSSVDGSTLVGTGRWIFFGEPGFFGPGSPAMLEASSGRFEIDLTDGSFLSRNGHRVDLCPLLAG